MADPYEDDDFTIYFKDGPGGRKGGELLDHLQHLEDDNLFRISLLQDDQQLLKKNGAEAQKKYAQMEKDINDVQKSI